MVKIAFLKLGNIASAPLLEFLLDERAEREDLEVITLGSGAKIGVDQAQEIFENMKPFNPELVIASSPNASLPGPKKILELSKKEGYPVIIVSDSPAKKLLKNPFDEGAGILIVEADSMIGARREFLDPAEMSIYNADLIKVLASTGAFNVIRDEIDKTIESLKKGEKLSLPKLVIDAQAAVDAAGFQNPYARTKSIAAYNIAECVASLTSRGCFVEKDRKKYVDLVSAAHEMMRTASLLCDEAREIEKYGDTLLRTPHYDDGRIMSKRKLHEKPA